jgi:thiamine-phosphate pyrophosphorylase
LRKDFPIKISTHRIIDANINRAKEGLRVCEEVARFILNSRSFTRHFKKIRHKIDYLLIKLFASRQGLLNSRHSRKDVGREIFSGELKRKNCQDIFSANIQRVEESLRVLEEFTKLSDAKVAMAFKRLRYDIYEIEKRITKRLVCLSNHR